MFCVKTYPFFRSKGETSSLVHSPGTLFRKMVLPTSTTRLTFSGPMSLDGRSLTVSLVDSLLPSRLLHPPPGPSLVGTTEKRLYFPKVGTNPVDGRGGEWSKVSTFVEEGLRHDVPRVHERL